MLPAAASGELAGPAPTPLERLLVNQIIICWLLVYDAACRYANRGRDTIVLHEATFLQSSQDRAQKRYLAAIKTLAQAAGERGAVRLVACSAKPKAQPFGSPYPEAAYSPWESKPQR